MLALLAARFGDVDLADDCVQDALVQAVETWRADGIPDNPAGWLYSVAHNRGDRPAAARGVGRPAAAGGGAGPDRADAWRTTRRCRSWRARGARRGRRRAAAAHAAVLPPCARSGHPGRPHPAPARRADHHARSRPRSCCPRRRWRSGSCGRSGRSGTRGSRCRSRPTCRLARRCRCSPCCISCSTRATWRAASRRMRCASRSRTKRCA